MFKNMISGNLLLIYSYDKLDKNLDKVILSINRNLVFEGISHVHDDGSENKTILFRCLATLFCPLTIEFCLVFLATFVLFVYCRYSSTKSSSSLLSDTPAGRKFTPAMLENAEK